MKITNNRIRMLVFIVLATTVFVLMALRPEVDGNAMNLGVPVSKKVIVDITPSEATSIEKTVMPEIEASEEVPSADTITESTTTN